MKKLILIVCASALVACGEFVSDSHARKALSDEGYTDITISGQHGIAPGFAGCGKDDGVGFDAVAKNTSGKRVPLLVCCGIVFKSCTVRHP